MRTRMSFGFSRESASQPRFHFSSAPGRKFSITMSQSRARRRAIAWPSACRRSSVIDFLLRDCTCHQSDTPLRITRQRRSGSPSPGGSTLITSAPKSASVLPQNGPAISVPSSRTLMPFRGPISLLPLEEAQRVVFENNLAALVHHLVREAHQAAVALRGESVLGHLALDVKAPTVVGAFTSSVQLRNASP